MKPHPTADELRLPLDPLLRMVGADAVAVVAEVCGVSRRTVLRWSHRGLTWAAADKAACSVGLNPASVWGWDWWMPEDEDEVA